MTNKAPATTLTTEIEWARDGTAYSIRSRADKTKELPGGVYRFVQTMVGWYLDRNATCFEFPFKVYDASDHVIARICRYWTDNGGNLGVLMNGLRGAGKTMTAQLLANRLIEERDLPVLVVREPIPLQIVFDAVRQDMMVIFDEFEKTHDEEAQQALLSTIDGMSRSSHNRLIIFTTNTASINENFRDRPSRIHYQFEFQRVADEIIEGLIRDSLPEDLHYLKNDIMSFLQTRAICTIDIVKAVISEVKTFRESPTAFEDILNVSKGEPPAYTISVLDPTDNSVKNVFRDYFKLNSSNERHLPLLSGNKRAIEEFQDSGRAVELACSSFDGTYSVVLLEKADEPNCWLAQLSVPKSKTIYADFPECYDHGYRFFYDVRPDGWDFPFTPEITKTNEEKRKKLIELYNAAANQQTMYGTRKRAVFKVRIEPNHDAVVYRRYKVTGNDYGWD